MPRKNKPTGTIRVVNLQGYTIPEIKEDYRNDWVTYGEDNNYFGGLIDNYLSSPNKLLLYQRYCRYDLRKRT